MRYARAPELAVRTSISRSWSRRWLRPLQQADCMCRLQCARGRYRHGWAAAGCPHADVGQAPVRWRITTDCAAAAARPKPCCLQGFDKGSWAPTGMARQARTRARWRCTALGRDAVACRAGALGRPSGRRRLFCGSRRWLDIAAAHRAQVSLCFGETEVCKFRECGCCLRFGDSGPDHIARRMQYLPRLPLRNSVTSRHIKSSSESAMRLTAA